MDKNTLPEDMRERVIKRTHEWIRDCGLDVRDVEAFGDRKLMPLLEGIAQETGKAYGGCHNCYGKGYASVNNSWHGHDTDGDIGSPGKYITGGDRNAMKFCTCERGQELERRFEETDRKAREDMTFKIMSPKTEGLFDNGDLFIKREPIEQAIINELGYEKFKAIQEAVDALQSLSKESK